MTNFHRAPAVAGSFYSADPATLRSDVARLLNPPQAPVQNAAGIMVPHAGYVYSGGVAGKVFAGVHIPESVIIIGPNHTGRGDRIAIAPDGTFQVPGKRDLAVDDILAAAIASRISGASRDAVAHQREHSIEVELPFLLARQPKLRIVPIVLGFLSATEAIELGEAIYDAVDAVASTGRNVLVVASSDMSHFLPDAEARERDQLALEPVLAFDPAGLFHTVRAHDISMCGYIPTTAMLAYAKRAGGQAPKLVDYATSGDAFGDRSRVVGYAGVVVPV